MVGLDVVPRAGGGVIEDVGWVVDDTGGTLVVVMGLEVIFEGSKVIGGIEWTVDDPGGFDVDRIEDKIDDISAGNLDGGRVAVNTGGTLVRVGRIEENIDDISDEILVIKIDFIIDSRFGFKCTVVVRTELWIIRIAGVCSIVAFAIAKKFTRTM